jgi:hypothetical protein
MARRLVIPIAAGLRKKPAIISATQVADIFSDEDADDHPPAHRRPRTGGPS